MPPVTEHVAHESQSLAAGQASVHALRKALANITAAVGGNIRKPQDLSRRFNLDKTLTWRISRAVREEDAWQALEHLPSRAGISIYANAMKTAGARAADLTVLDNALDEFERFIADHAVDRHTLDVIVSNTKTKGSIKRFETLRKGGFQNNASLLGVRAKMHFVARLVAPSPKDQGLLRMAIVAGLVDLFRLRSDSSWPVATIRSWQLQNGENRDTREPIEPIAGGSTGLPDATRSPLLPSFCSPSDLKLDISTDSAGATRFVVRDGPVGASGAITAVYGWLHMDTTPAVESSPGERGEHVALMQTPAEGHVFDLLMHKSVQVPIDPRVEVYSLFPGSIHHPHPGSEQSRLPVPTDLEELTIDDLTPPCPELDRYHELLELSASRLETKLSDYRMFRYRLAYPPVPAMCVVSHGLRKK